jgi:hypothetical protein
VCGSRDEHEGRQGIQKSFQRINRRENISWKAQKKWGWIDAMDKDANRMLKCRSSKRPRPKLGCSAIGREEIWRPFRNSILI